MNNISFDIPGPDDIKALIDTATAPLAARIDALEHPLLPPVNVPAPVYPSGEPMSTDVPAGWKVAMEIAFELDADEGPEFAAAYGAKVRLYPSPWLDTTKRGKYGEFVSVKDGIMTARNFVDATGQPRCTSVLPLVHSASMIFEERTRFTRVGTTFKAAHLWWPDSNHSTNWTDATGTHKGGGEVDFPEFDGNATTANAYVHFPGMDRGAPGFQQPFSTTVNLAAWNTYRTIQIAGKSITFMANGTLVGEQLTKVPTESGHLSFQNETSIVNSTIDPKSSLLVETDWIRVLVPA